MLKAGVKPTFKVSREKKRHAPVEMKDGVALWGRKHGRTAQLRWYDAPMNCWAVLLGYRVGDPRAQDGSQGEPVFLHEWKEGGWWAKHRPEQVRRKRDGTALPGYLAYELDDLGLSGIINILDKGDLLSGRGEFNSAAEAGRKQVEKFRTQKHRKRRAAQDDAAHRARDRRRHYLKIPFINVGIDIGKRA